MAKTAPTSLAKRFPDRDEVAAVRAEADALEAGAEAAETRRLAGRILGRRGHGKLVFLDLVDRSGQIQLLCSAERTGPVELDLGDVVGAIGKAAKTRRGEPSLAVDELVLLAKIKRPLPDTYHGLVDAETRYRKRYLDLLVNEDARRAFELRSRMVAAIRRRLDEAGFIEVETPVLQPRYGGAFADPFVTHHNELDADLYLRIATELYLKRLIVGGLEKVYEIGKDFRNEGISYKHQPEFTMLEWYEAFADYADTMTRIEELVAAVAVDTTGSTEVEFRGNRVNLAPPWQRLRLADALEELGLWTRDEADLRARLEERGVDASADRSWSQLVDHALSHFIEPELIQPTILHDYPVELSPFARTMDDDPSFTERFEYFAAGMELGNAYSELNDPDEQARRFAEQAAAIGGVQGDPGLRGGPLLRDAAHGRAGARHRPPGDAPHRAGDDPRRHSLPGAAGARRYEGRGRHRAHGLGRRPDARPALRTAAVVRAILGGEALPLEIVVVDQSEDESTKRALDLIGDERVRHVPLRPPSTSAARNEGARLARGEYVAFLDDDVEITTSWLAALIVGDRQARPPRRALRRGACTRGLRARSHPPARQRLPRRGGARVGERRPPGPRRLRGQLRLPAGGLPRERRLRHAPRAGLALPRCGGHGSRLPAAQVGLPDRLHAGVRDRPRAVARAERPAAALLRLQPGRGRLLRQAPALGRPAPAALPARAGGRRRPHGSERGEAAVEGPRARRGCPYGGDVERPRARAQEARRRVCARPRYFPRIPAIRR